ncbi:MAG: hypothetical protein ACLR0P_04090, partial [Oscillospiraceae bacterium]
KGTRQVVKAGNPSVVFLVVKRRKRRSFPLAAFSYECHVLTKKMQVLSKPSGRRHAEPLAQRKRLRFGRRSSKIERAPGIIKIGAALIQNCSDVEHYSTIRSPESCSNASKIIGATYFILILVV